MCKTIIEYSCGHNETLIHTLCLAEMAHLPEIVPSKGCFNFMSLFQSKPKEKIKRFICVTQPCSQTSRDECRDCKTKHARANAYGITAREAIHRARSAHKAETAEHLQECKRSDTKRAFRCSACTAEHRRISERERSANGGFCCARGSEEFERAKRNRGVISNSHSQRNRRTDSVRTEQQAPLPREERHPHLKLVTSQEFSRTEAHNAAMKYGWNESRVESIHLEPELVAEFIKMPGTNQESLPPQPQSTTSLNCYEPAIDWKRWADAPQTNHGRYPPPYAPAPDKPLPIIPLRTHRMASALANNKPLPVLPTQDRPACSPTAGQKPLPAPPAEPRSDSTRGPATTPTQLRFKSCPEDPMANYKLEKWSWKAHMRKPVPSHRAETPPIQPGVGPIPLRHKERRISLRDPSALLNVENDVPEVPSLRLSYRERRPLRTNSPSTASTVSATSSMEYLALATANGRRNSDSGYGTDNFFQPRSNLMMVSMHYDIEGAMANWAGRDSPVSPVSPISEPSWR
jgi:hypothetical protein